MRRVLVTLLLFASHAGAQVQDDVPAEPSHWADARARWFFSATLELGFPYARPKLAAGRGRPHWEWVGAEGLPIVTTEGAGLYGGFRGQVPHLDVRFGARYFAPFERSLLDVRESYGRLDIEQDDGPNGGYTAYEAELASDVDLFAGRLFTVLTGYYVPDMHRGFYLYEESLKVVMAPPWVWRGRVGYAFAFGADGKTHAGPAVDVIGLPGREETVIRAGVVAVSAISSTVDLQATFVPVIASPDSIGLAGADFGHLGVRWRWATGQVPD